MIVTTSRNEITVTRGPNDPRASTEANFWYQLSKAMPKNALGRWMRVRPNKFAMTGMPFALRLGRNKKRNLMILDNDYMLRQAHQPYNKREPVRLASSVVESI